MLECTRKAAGWPLSRGRTTIAVSDYVTSALFQHLYAGSAVSLLISMSNAMDEARSWRSCSWSYCRSLIRINGLGQNERKLLQNNLFTAIMRCEFMPLPGGTTTNSLLKCDKNSANGSAVESPNAECQGRCTMAKASSRDGAWHRAMTFKHETVKWFFNKPPTEHRHGVGLRTDLGVEEQAGAQDEAGKLAKQCDKYLNMLISLLFLHDQFVLFLSLDVHRRSLISCVVLPSC